MNVEKAHKEWNAILANIAKHGAADTPMTQVILSAETVLVVNSVLEKAIAVLTQVAVQSAAGQMIVADANAATQTALAKMMGKTT